MSALKGWIGVDLDGTLAVYDTWRGSDHIGEPVKRMTDRVKQWLESGRDVRILTARVSPEALALNNEKLESVRGRIEEWCLENLGKKLPICYSKDMAMVELWDDRCVQVIPNTGERADGKP